MENTEDLQNQKSILKDVAELNCCVQKTLKEVISINSNLSNDLEAIVLERRSEPSLSIGRKSANLLVDLKKTSVELLNNLQNYDTSDGNPELKEGFIVDLHAPLTTVEHLKSYIKSKDEFNKYLKMIAIGIQKMAMNTKIQSNDSGRHISLSGINDTTIPSDDFDVNNLRLATSSPMKFSRSSSMD